MGKEKNKIGNNRIKEINIRNILQSIAKTYKQNLFEIVLLFLNVILLPFFCYIYRYILHDKLIYFILFLCCGALVFAIAKLNKQKQFIKIMIIFVFTLLILNFSLSMLFTILAFGGKQGHLIWSYVPAKSVILSLTTKYTAISTIFYSFWTLIFIFVPKHLSTPLEKKTLIIAYCILAVCFIVILFYPAIHTILFDSDHLLKQFMS